MNMQFRPTTAAADFLEDVADELEVPESRYEQAETSYHSLGDWLNRDNSTIRQYEPEVYSQGSFALGTVIAPISDEEHYDVDAVCEFRRLNKASVSQKRLKELLGNEVRAYAQAQNMKKPVEEHRRCWRLEYADGAQFHMDVTPGVPNAAEQKLMLERMGHDVSWAVTAIAITDKDAPTYSVISNDWCRSNPKGYRKWFHSRMRVVFDERKRELAKSIRAGTEDIPDYKVRTPLQSSIMILKRHRDMMFADRGDERPISIILTTLSAHSYNGEREIADALFAILSQMDQHIHRDDQGRFWIPNPTDPAENFADKWAKHPERAKAFFEWLAQAREDFARAAELSNKQMIAESLSKGIGSGLSERAKRRALGAPAVLSQGLVRSEAEARRSAVRIEGDRRNA